MRAHPPITLTTEQSAVVHHDPARHATVLAVAGSGKTTTMAHRVAHLVAGGTAPRAIRAVMYNTSARRDFERQLGALGQQRVPVQTFHAMGFGILNWARSRGFAPEAELVTDDGALRELGRRALLEAAGQEAKARSLDVDAFLDAVSTWKALLTAPEDAHHLEEPAFVEGYRTFEQLRRQKGWITFDDQIYEAVRLLEGHGEVRAQLIDRLDHLIIDEFQDVNPARLRLAQLLAGERARVMVVGDDDQCIYEWQGARSVVIKRGVTNAFPHHAHASYSLTRSFRFGPLLASVAGTVIAHNSDRIAKALVAHDPAAGGVIELHCGTGGSGVKQAVPRLRELLAGGVAPTDIVVLVRKYSQALLLQSHLLASGLPFYVDGEVPLAVAYPVGLALDYIEVCDRLDEALDSTLSQRLEFIVHRPGRYVKKLSFAKVLRGSVRTGKSPAATLKGRTPLRQAGLFPGAIENLKDLEQVLRQARRCKDAGLALRHILDGVNFMDLFLRFEGGSAAEHDVALMRSLAVLLHEARVPLKGARAFVDELDPRQGRPDEACVRVTSIFKAKGLEWDHVFLPDLVEGQHPDLRETANVCLSKRAVEGLEPTDAEESERRLFYVAATRARWGLYLFADPDDDHLLSRFLIEAQLEAAREAAGAIQTLAAEPEHKAAARTLRKAACTSTALRQHLAQALAALGEDTHARLILSVTKADAQPTRYPKGYA